MSESLQDAMIVAGRFKASIAVLRRLMLAAVVVAVALRSHAADMAIGDRYPAGEEVYRCTFDRLATSGKSIEPWPEGWNRERSAAYPPYVDVQVASAPAEVGGHCLRVTLDGGAAAAFSPAIPASSLYNYVLECLVQTEGLVNDRATMSLTFYDAQNNVLERQVSSSVTGTTSWTRLRLGPMSVANSAVDHAVIGLQLEPGERADLHGTASFADVWLARLPRVE